MAEHLVVNQKQVGSMHWLEDTTDITDTETKLFSDFNSFKNFLNIDKNNVLFLKDEVTIPGIRTGCFLRWLVENINLSSDTNIVMWVNTKMMHTTQSGVWTRTIYQDCEEKMLKAIRQIAEHLHMPAENVLFLVPGDEFQRDKIGEFIANLLDHFDNCKNLAIVWFKCTDSYHPRILRRMLL
jgi:hypothetical protein